MKTESIISIFILSVAVSFLLGSFHGMDVSVYPDKEVKTVTSTEKIIHRSVETEVVTINQIKKRADSIPSCALLRWDKDAEYCQCFGPTEDAICVRKIKDIDRK